MIKKIFIKTYHLLRYSIIYIKRINKLIFYLVLPNIKSILLIKKVVFSQYPKCYQKTLFTGAGKIEIGLNTIVAGKFPSNVIIGDVPAKIIKLV